MTLADLTEEQKEEIYQLFFCGRLITEWTDGKSKERVNNSIKYISNITGISPFIVNSHIDKCIEMRRELSKPIQYEISEDEQEITLTYKSRINYGN